ncbi:CubicO group peptidase, beta-lactamase class C family [Pseudomonas cuatrocienegasensis]|uniref:CubicO group peptidase, beta-lactamase class C family n=1 Tax=Pseudomonas cuatrocienegasensis TaxID=543360 RepID=A0ABY1B4K7_9PSED|nr:hydrolase [Pseudomonas sp. 21C1]SEP90473.1 CubicO group peptidase, beta-lactamase class C family [Pseudomonas cuatrocienegasensis]
MSLHTDSPTARKLARHYADAHEALLSDVRPDTFMTGFPPAEAQRVTWANWMSPPFNKWGFRHLARLRPSITVAAGEGAPSRLPVAAEDLDGFSFESICGLTVRLDEHLLASHCDAFIVLHRGQVKYERYFNGQTPSDRHIMFSVTKSLIGVLAEQLICEGVMNPQLRADHYVPEFAGSAFADATVRQLLDMAVGIAYTERYDDPTSESSQFGYACGFQPAPAAYAKHASLYQYLPSLLKKGEHGGFFHYVTATTEALAWVMERASGKACAQMLADVWQQLGCQRDGYFMADPWGRGVAGAGYSATARDIARFGLMLANDGLCDGRRVLDSRVVDAIAQGSDPAIYAANEEFSNWTPGASYRSQWYVFNDHSQALMACGISGQYLFVDRDADVVIVKQSSLPEAVSVFDPDNVRALRALARHYAG